MKNRNLEICVVTAAALCLMSASAFGAGGFEAAGVGFVEKIVTFILLVAPYLIAIAMLVAACFIPTRGWTMFLATVVAGFIIGAVKLGVEFSSGMTL